MSTSVISGGVYRPTMKRNSSASTYYPGFVSGAFISPSPLGTITSIDYSNLTLTLLDSDGASIYSYTVSDLINSYPDCFVGYSPYNNNQSYTDDLYSQPRTGGATYYFYFNSSDLDADIKSNYLDWRGEIEYTGYITFITGGTSYTVTYHVNGGTAVSSTTGSTLPNPLPISTKSHFVLNGWFIGTSSSCTYASQATAGQSISADTHLWAQWIPAGSYIKGKLINHVREYYRQGNSHR